MILVVLSTHAELASATVRGRSYWETGELCNGLSQRIALEVYIRNSQSTRLRLVDSESRMYTSSAILLYIIFYLKHHLLLETSKGTYWNDPSATRPWRNRSSISSKALSHKILKMYNAQVVSAICDYISCLMTQTHWTHQWSGILHCSTVPCVPNGRRSLQHLNINKPLVHYLKWISFVFSVQIYSRMHADLSLAMISMKLNMHSCIIAKFA